MDVLLKKYFWIVTLLVIALCATLGGRAAAHIVEQNFFIADDAQGGPNGPTARRGYVPPLPSERTHSKEIERIVSRNVFCSSCAPIKDEPVATNATIVGDRPPAKSALPLDLVSTMWVKDQPRWSMAVIRDAGSKEKDVMMYNAGKVIAGTEAKVLRVDPRKVYILNNGAIEYLELEGQEKKKEEPATAVAMAGPMMGGDPLDNDVAKGVRCSGSNCEVDRPLIDKLLSNTTALATAARFVPSVKDGHPNGFKLYAIRPSSIFGKIGLQNGDTIKSINGMEMSSPDQALGVYSKLRSASHLTVSVDRRGETVTLDYSIR